MVDRECFCADKEASALYPSSCEVAKVRRNFRVDSKDKGTLRYRAMFNPPWVQPLDQLSLSLGRYKSNGFNSCVDFKLCT